MKLSIRLKCISDMINNNQSIIDIGCDHGLLDIYLTTFKNCDCIASDISENVLANTKINVGKYNLDNKIQIVCSDGLTNIDIKKNSVIVISGMGTNTIINILKNEKVNSIDNLIIQSNNEIETLRKFVVKLGFYIENEKILEENKKDYVVIYFKRGKKIYNNNDYLFGPIARYDICNKNYFLKLYKKNKEILKKIPNKYFLKKIKQYKYIRKIKKFTCMK